MPLKVEVAYDTLCHNGESRMSRPLYTIATEMSNTLCHMILSSTTLGNASFVTLFHTEVHVVTGSFTFLSRPSLTLICVKRPAHSPLTTVADATVVMR